LAPALADQNELVLKAILEKAAAGGAGRTANEQKIGDYYATCMNVDAVNQAGLKPLQPLLDRIDALKSKDQLPELAAYLDSIGVNTLFAFGSDQDFKDATQQIAVLDQLELGLPEKGYYQRTDEKSVKLRNYLRAFEEPGIDIADYEEAAHMHNLCRRQGLAGSAIDFLICAVAQRREWHIFYNWPRL